MKAIKNISIIFGSVLLFLACKSSTKPDGILPEAEMQNIVQDVLLIDGYVATISRPDSAVMLRKAYMNAIYEKYHIDSNVFRKNSDYYNSNPELIAKMYEKIQTELDTLNKKYQKQVDSAMKFAPPIKELERIK